MAAINSKIDTTALYNQIQADLASFKGTEQAEFLAWFENIKGKLSGDVAANLQAQIEGKQDQITAENAPSIAALLGGHIDVCTGHPGEVMQYVESGDAVAIGIFNDERDPRENLKDIPTFKEMGYDVTMSVWKFLMLPAGTPEDVVTKVTETLTAITETDEYKEFCDANQLLPLTMTTEEMVERINEEAAVNQELLVG